MGITTRIASFRIDHDDGYSDRYNSTTRAIRSEALGGTIWDGTTSFIILRSQKSASELADAIYYGSSLSPFTDTLVVLDPSNGDASFRGIVPDKPTLDHLLHDNALM